MVSTVTTASATAVMGDASGTLSLIAVLVFLSMLVAREILSGTPGATPGALARGLTIGVVPLGLGFVIIAAIRLLQLLG